MVRYLLAFVFVCSFINSSFAQSPTISSFSPTKAGAGMTVTITGNNFTGATGVSFGGVSARSFSVTSVTSITAIINSSAISGNISVFTPSGTATSAGFVFELPPSITNFTPVVGPTGQQVTIYGTNLQDATAVTFGGTPAASFTGTSSTKISAVVANGSTGNVVVTTPGGTATATGFNYGHTVQVPIITSFAPSSGTSQSSVVIKGNNLNSVSGVTFGGTPAASFTINSATQITAVIGAGTSGIVNVTSPNGASALQGYTFVSPPSVSSFFPNSVTTTQSVVISGSNFSGVTGVSFGGVPASSFTIISASQINATAGAGTSGTITLTAGGQTFSAAGYLTVISGQGAPTITSYSRLSATNGDAITLQGTNFTGATAVKFGGTDAASFSVISSTQINAVVGSGSSGIITVATHNGTGAMSGFTYQFPIPTITSFSPTSAAPGQTITITGTNFSNATAVNFGAALARSFTVNSPTFITAVVDSAASGAVAVTNAGGTAILNGFTYNGTRSITSFTPVVATTGDTVTITGTNLSGVDSVYFGSSPASLFKINSPSSISAVVGNGSSGYVVVKSSYNIGVGRASGFTFVSPGTVPTLTSANSLTAKQGDVITLTGTNLTGVTSVRFGGTSASAFKVNSSTSISATVGAGANGNIVVSNGRDTAKLIGFNFVPVPTIAVSGSTIILSTQTVTLSASPATGFGYMWMKDGVAINGATTATYTTGQSGQYSVVITLNGVVQLAAPVVITSMFDLPFNAFSVKAVSATCKGSANGFIILQAKQTGSYTATVTSASVNGQPQAFTDSLQITNLAAGTYNVCVGVTGQPNYNKCFTVVISEPKDLSVYVAPPTPNNKVILQLAGNSSYFITLNGITTTTTQSQVTLQLVKGKNTILVNTGQDCQGMIEKDITVGQDIPYPNPFNNQISIDLGPDVVKMATIKITDIFGKPVYTANYSNANGTVSLDLSNLKNGVYLFNLSADNAIKLFKIMKQ